MSLHHTLAGRQRYTAFVAALVLGACLNAPARPTGSDDAGGGADAAAIDASRNDAAVIDALVVDGSAVDASLADASPVGTGLPFPPAAMTINITGGWSGDLNGDGADDVILLSDTGSNTTAGFYVLFGQPATLLADYHQYVNTGDKDPLSVIGTQLDNAGTRDIVLFAVDYNGAGQDDNESYLLAYVANGVTFAEPALENWVSAGPNMSWQIPFAENNPTALLTARLKPTGQPSLVALHSRGGFVLTLPSWSSSNFSNTSAEALLTGQQVGAHAVTNPTNSAVDDLVVWTDAAANMKWLKNDGDGNLSDTVVTAEARGPIHAEMYDMDGMPPLDVIGIIQTEIQAVPVDNNGGTTSAEYNGQSYITGVGNAIDLLVFDSDAAGVDSRPEIVFVSGDCATTNNDPCVYMIRNAFIDGGTGQLKSPSAPGQWQLPSGFVPRVMFRGDFDGDGSREVVVVGADGTMQCVRIDDATFSACS